MESNELKNICKNAIDGAIASRGKHKGKLKSKCPAMGTDAAAAWQALMIEANPFKVGIGHMVFFTARQQEIYDAIQKSIAGLDLRNADRDREALERLGAW